MDDLAACLHFILRLTEPEMRERIAAEVHKVYQPGAWDSTGADRAADAILSLLMDGTP